MRRLASLATARSQAGHRKQYEPDSSSEHTRTVRSVARSCTSPQLGQLARIVVTVKVPLLHIRRNQIGRALEGLEALL